MSYQIQMMKSARPAHISSTKIPLRVWWWRMFEDGVKCEGGDNGGWATSKQNAYETGLSRMKALKEQEVADR